MGSVGRVENDRARLLLLAAYLFLVITCYATTKALRDSLFIAAVGPSQLPLLYVLIAIGMALVSTIYPKAIRKKGLHPVIQTTSIAGIISFLVFWKLVAYGGRASLYVLYVWVSLFGAIAVSQVWSLASQVFNPREARRSFAWIGLGGVLGGILGGALAGVVAPWLGVEALFPISAILMAASIVIVQWLMRFSPRDATGARVNPAGIESPPSISFAPIQKSPYVSMLAGLLVLGVVVEAFVDYGYKTIAYLEFDSRDQLASFFGTMTSCGGLLALVVQAFVTNRVLQRFGVGVAIVLLPSALLVSFALVALSPGLWAVAILKLVDSCLSYSVHRSGMELMYMPIPAKSRASVMALLDLLVDRGGRAIGGALLFALAAGLALSIPALSLVAMALLLAWLGMGIAARHQYVAAFRSALTRRVIEPEGLDADHIDGTSRRALVSALRSTDDRQALYAMDMLARSHPQSLREQAPALAQHKSAAVRSRAIALLTEIGASLPACVMASLADPDLEVRIQAVRHLCDTGPRGRRAMKEFLTHADSGVVLASVHCIVRYRIDDGDLIDETWIARAVSAPGGEGANARIAAARALAIAAVPGTAEYLDRLLEDPDANVVCEAIRTAGSTRYSAAVPRLVLLLASSMLRREARAALLMLGQPAFDELRCRFLDAQTPLAVRVHIPKTLSLSGTQAAADLLLHCAGAVNREVDVPLIKALNRMRSRWPDVRLDGDRIRTLIRETAIVHRHLGSIRQTLRSGRGNRAEAAQRQRDLLEKALGERMAESVERVLRLLQLIYAPADIRSVRFTVNVRPVNRAAAVEFLDNLMDTSLRDVVLPMMEQGDSGPQTRIEMSEREAIHLLLKGNDSWLKLIARELAEEEKPVGVLST